MSYASLLSPLPSGAFLRVAGLWRQRLWQLVTVLSLALVLGACGGGGGGGGGGGDSGGGGTGGGGGTNPPPTGAPAIVGQPSNVSVTAGQPASFSITVTGTAPLTYEWSRNGVVIAGSNAATYTIASTAVADSGAQFSVAVSNAAGRVTSTPATLTVSAAVMAPSLTAQPAGVTTTVGQTARFEATATGSEPLVYQWQRNGAAIAGATTAGYTTPVLALADNGAVYTITVSNAAGTVTSAGALLTVNALATAPAITAQPAGQTVAVGQSATFRVAATGSPAPTFQWQRNGVDIAGATGDTYATPSTTLADNGVVFAVIVRNSAGNVTSANAVLTVTGSPVAPSITTQPTAQSVITGQSATFSVAATGTSPLTYQWLRNGLELAGANAAAYTTPALTEANSGAIYTVAVSNSAGTVTSGPALLTVNPIPVAPAITTQPVSQTVTAGARASFIVAASGTGPLSFQWSRNGSQLAGATSAGYNTPPTTAADNGAIFQVVVRNAAGSVTSSTATLTVSPAATAPSITRQPSSQSVIAGQPASFSVVAEGSTPLTYQWQRNGTDIVGATADTFRLPATVLEDNGAVFTVIVRNGAGTVTSSPAGLGVNPVPVAPTILTQPSSQGVFVGQAAGFVVRVAGTAPFSFQWRRNGVNIGGANQTSYNTPLATLADSGATFDVVISNAAGSITSDVASLTVTPPVVGNYWLRGPAGVFLAGNLGFADGPKAANGYNLTLVDPGNPSAPQVAEARGTWLQQAVISEPRFNPQNAGDSSERLMVYARGTRLWRLDLQAGLGTPTPVQVSSASLGDLCAPSPSDAQGLISSFQNSIDATRSVLQYRVPGPDALCFTPDDGYVAMRVNASATTAPVSVPRLLASLRNTSGDITGFLARSGNQIQRLNADFGGASNLFTVGAGEIELLREPAGQGVVVIRDNGQLRAFDPNGSGSPSTIGAVGGDFLQLGEVGTTTPTAIYRNNGAIVAFRLDGTAAPSTLQTLAAGESVSRGGGGGQLPLQLVISSGSSSRLVQVSSALALSVQFTESGGVIDAGSVGSTPTRWVYTVANGRTLRTVPLAGGTPQTVAQSSQLRVFNQGSWNYEALWYDLRGPGDAVPGSSLQVINADGGSLDTFANAATVGGAIFNGFSDTSVGRTIAQPLSADPSRPYSGATLLVLDPITRGVRLTYGALASAGYNTIDVTGVSGPNRPVLITASSFQALGGSSTDLYFVRVGSPGLVRVTNFVP